MKRIIVSALLLSIPALSGCDLSGGSYNDNAGAAPKALLTGVVASGNPWVGATVNVKDSAGISASAATTDANGRYTVDVSGLASPFRIMATAASGTAGSPAPMFTLATNSGQANVTPLTTLVFNTISQTRGTTAAAVFNASVPPLPGAAELASYTQVIRNIVAPALGANGVSSATISGFDPTTTDFVANGTGVDKVLDNTTVGTNGSGNTTLTVKNDSTGSAYNSTTTITVTADSTGSNSSAQFSTSTTTDNQTTTGQPPPPASTSAAPPPPGVLQFRSGSQSVNENAGSATVTVTRTGGSAGSVSVHFVTSDGTGIAGTDYAATSGTLSWADGDTAAKTFPVSIIDRNLACGTHTVNLTLSLAAGTALGVQSTTVLTINDNDGTGTCSATPTLQGIIYPNGDLKLYDPTHALGTSNPVTVDTGVSQGVDKTFISINVSGTTLSNLRTTRAVYPKGSKLYKLNLEIGQSNTPVQISSLTDVCSISEREEDFANVDNSFVQVRRTGPDATCNTSDDVFTTVHLSSGTSDAGITIAGLRHETSIQDSSGHIVGYLTQEGTSPVTLTKRDANLANPQVLMNLDPTSGFFSSLNNVSFQAVYLRLRPQGQTADQLFRFDFAAGTLSSALYTYAASQCNGHCFDSYDANNIYFADGNAVYRTARTATTASSTLVTTLTSGLQITKLKFSQATGRLVINAQDSSGNGAVFAVAANSTNATATTLQSLVSGTRANLRDGGVAGGLVYITTSSGTNQQTETAILVHDDGTGATSTANAYWAGTGFPFSFDYGTTSPRDVTRSYILLASKGSSGDTLQVVDPTTGTVGITLGTVASAAPGSSIDAGANPGRYGMLQCGISRSGGVDSDVYSFDSQTANSLQGVATTPGGNDVLLQN